ncbi:MAG TPA: hypothetical protein VG867_07745 [Rhizomicrobium sp.]|nr:hypothetical protein [Rhizomicrobium sp.]
MSVPCKFETSLLKHDEREAVLASHHPAIYDASLDDLKALRRRLRDLRDKEQTMARAKRREQRGKGAERGASFPGTAERPFQRKQVFVSSLKRVNKEIGRREHFAARSAHVEAAYRALAMRRAAQFPARPDAGYTAHEGMRPLASQRRRTAVSGAMIGRVSQATRIAQAAHDARN